VACRGCTCQQTHESCAWGVTRFFLQAVLNEVITHLGLSDYLEVTKKATPAYAFKSGNKSAGVRRGRYAEKSSEWPAPKVWTAQLGAKDCVQVVYTQRWQRDVVASLQAPGAIGVSMPPPPAATPAPALADAAAAPALGRASTDEAQCDPSAADAGTGLATPASLDVTARKPPAEADAASSVAPIVADQISVAPTQGHVGRQAQSAESTGASHAVSIGSMAPPPVLPADDSAAIDSGLQGASGDVQPHQVAAEPPQGRGASPATDAGKTTQDTECSLM
jgi:hypothetical protein